MNTQETNQVADDKTANRPFSDFEIMLTEEVFKKILTPAGEWLPPANSY